MAGICINSCPLRTGFGYSIPLAEYRPVRLCCRNPGRRQMAAAAREGDACLVVQHKRKPPSISPGPQVGSNPTPATGEAMVPLFGSEDGTITFAVGRPDGAIRLVRSVLGLR